METSYWGSPDAIAARGVLRQPPLYFKPLNPLPARAALDVGDLNALLLQLPPEAARLGEVLGLLRLVALDNQRVNGRVPLAGDDVVIIRGIDDQRGVDWP